MKLALLGEMCFTGNKDALSKVACALWERIRRLAASVLFGMESRPNRVKPWV